MFLTFIPSGIPRELKAPAADGFTEESILTKEKCMLKPWITLSFAAALMLTSNVWASSEDNQALDEAVQTMDAEAAQPGGEVVVNNKLKVLYDATDAQIADMRQKNMGYGEIGMTYSLAEQMEGGATEENIQAVINARQSDEGKQGWGNVAKELGVKPGKVLQPLKGAAMAGEDVVEKGTFKKDPSTVTKDWSQKGMRKESSMSGAYKKSPPNTSGKGNK
jgi:hypothetical protein